MGDCEGGPEVCVEPETATVVEGSVVCGTWELPVVPEVVWGTGLPVTRTVLLVDMVVAGSGVDRWAVMVEVSERWEVVVLPVENEL